MAVNFLAQCDSIIEDHLPCRSSQRTSVAGLEEYVAKVEGRMVKISFDLANFAGVRG